MIFKGCVVIELLWFLFSYLFVLGIFMVNRSLDDSFGAAVVVAIVDIIVVVVSVNGGWSGVGWFAQFFLCPTEIQLRL